MNWAGSCHNSSGPGQPRKEADLAIGADESESLNGLHPCTYCGVPADTIDHVVPQHLLKRAGDIGLNLFELFRIRNWTVPACRECNSALGGRIFRTLGERRKYAHDHIRRKYRSWLRMPDWREDEIAEMGPLAQRDIRAGLRMRDWARARLRWQGCSSFTWASDVYEFYRKVADAEQKYQPAESANETETE